MKGTLGSSLVTIVNLYLTNLNQIAYLEPVLSKLSKFAEGAVIVGGDMNFTLDPTLDASRKASQILYATLKRLKKSFYAFHLVDVWQILHPTLRDYTFYSHPHDSSSRIDLLMLLLSRLISASIGSITFSDHAPVFVDIDLLPPTPKQWRSKLNDSLIQTPEVREEISRELSNFFSSNVGFCSAPRMVWEAHKIYILGVLIELGSRVK